MAGLLRRLAFSTFIGLAVSMIVAYTKTGPYNPGPSADLCQTLEDEGHERGFGTWAAFYPYYLCEHTNPKTKLFHFVATINAAVFLLTFIFNRFNLKVSSGTDSLNFYLNINMYLNFKMVFHAD